MSDATLTPAAVEILKAEALRLKAILIRGGIDEERQIRELKLIQDKLEGYQKLYDELKQYLPESERTLDRRAWMKGEGML